MTFLPPGELRPTDREREIAAEMIAQLNARLGEDDLAFGPTTSAAMAAWMAAILCGYRLELLAGTRLIGRQG